MMKKNRSSIAVGFILMFVLWTLMVRFVDVRVIGPDGSSVGLATLNGFVHDHIGSNMFLYAVTDWLGLVPIGTAFVFAVLGLTQLIKRKSLLEVDRSIIALGVLYVVVVLTYFFFEAVVVNYRPILIDGRLEASYPSSTTMLVLCVMPTAAMQLNARIKCKPLRRCLIIAIIAFIAFTVVGRLLSGVHWITDIIGGALISAGLVTMYGAFCQY